MVAAVTRAEWAALQVLLWIAVLQDYSCQLPNHPRDCCSGRCRWTLNPVGFPSLLVNLCCRPSYHR